MSLNTRFSHRLLSVILLVLIWRIHRVNADYDGYVSGADYPDYKEVPKGLSFTCDDKIPGYYADPEARCQVWHWCVPGLGGNTMYSFVCGEGTVFNQRTRVCDYFYNVDCPNAQSYYGVNEDLYKDDTGNYIAGKKGFNRSEKWRRMSTNLNRRRKRHEKEKRMAEAEVQETESKSEVQEKQAKRAKRRVKTHQKLQKQ